MSFEWLNINITATNVYQITQTIQSDGSDMNANVSTVAGADPVLDDGTIFQCSDLESH